MRFGIKHLILLSILLAVLSYSIVYVSDRAFKPLLSEKRDLGPDLTFQKTYERSIESNISRLLQRLYGDKNYLVNVSSQMQTKNEETETITFKPVTVSDNVSEKVEGNFESMKNRIMENKPDVDKLREELANRLAPLKMPITPNTSETETEQGSPVVIPTLIDRNRIPNRLTKSLPGFPFQAPQQKENVLTETKGTDQTKEPGALNGPELANLFPEKEMIDKGSEENKDQSKYSYSTNTNKNMVMFNQVKTKSSTPGKSIERMIISVMVDEKRFKMVGIDETILKNYIRNVAYLNEERGDKLEISIFPFPVNTMDLGDFYYKYWPAIQKSVAALPKFKWLFVTLLIFLAAGLGMFGVAQSLKSKRASRENNYQETAKVQQQVQEQEAIKIANEMEQKKIDIIMMAKSKPQDFARIILNWVEKSNS